MTGGEYALGLLVFGATAGMVAASATLLLRARAPRLAGASSAIAWSVLFTAGLLVAHLVPGILGLLTRWTVLACSGVLLGACALITRSRATAGRERMPDRPADTAWSLAIGATAVAALAVGVLASLRDTLTTPIVHSDTLNYHFAVVADWIGHESVWGVAQFEPGLAAGNYPQNGDVPILAAVLPWGEDAFARFATLPYLALAGLVVFGLCRELAVPRSTALVASAVLASTYTLAYPTVVLGLPDAVAASMLGAGILFLLRHLRTEHPWDLALAGIALGIALGSKWYAVPAVVVPMALWAGVWLVRRRGVGWVATRAAGVAGLVALFGGFWLVRNWVESGSPVFPSGVEVLGSALFDVPHDYYAARFGHSVSEYLLDADVWRTYLLPAYREALGLAGPAVAVGFLLALARLARGWRAGPAARAALLPAAFTGVAALMLTGVYVNTPYSALGEAGAPILVKQNARYLLPALMLAVPLMAWGVQMLGRFRAWAELALLLVVVDGIRRSLDPGVTATVQVLVVGALLALIAVALRRSLWSGASRPGRGVAVGAAAVAATVFAVAGLGVERRVEAHRFQGQDPAIDWVEHNAPAGTKIGLAGTNAFDGTPPAYPMFGPELGNDVSYVGPQDKGGLRHYHSSRAFGRALREGGFELLVVGRATQFDDRGTHPLTWARAAGFQPVTRSRSLTLLRAPRD